MNLKTSPPGPLSGTERGDKKRKIPVRGKLSSGVVALQYVEVYKKEQARTLRKTGTNSERLIWEHLRNRKIAGLKFRRQQVIDGFIADFFCEKAKIVVEIDGGIHNQETQQRIDKHRDEVFQAKGLYVLRITNDDVLKNILKTISLIKTTACLRAELLPLSTVERGG